MKLIAFGLGFAVGIVIVMGFYSHENTAMQSCLEHYSQDVCVATLGGN